MKVHISYIFAPSASLDADTRAYSDAQSFPERAKLHVVTAGLTEDPGAESLTATLCISDAQGNLAELCPESEISNRSFLSAQSPDGMPLPPNARLAIDVKSATAAVTSKVRFMVVWSEP